MKTDFKTFLEDSLKENYSSMKDSDEEELYEFIYNLSVEDIIEYGNEYAREVLNIQKNNIIDLLTTKK